ncbi:SPW repeat domain-containing protein, partial [Streptomyces xantholiticus]
FSSAYERTHAMAWTACAIGAWTIISPWVVAGDMATTRSVVNNIIVGVVALLCGLAMAAAAGTRGEGGGGRRRPASPGPIS